MSTKVCDKCGAIYPAADTVCPSCLGKGIERDTQASKNDISKERGGKNNLLIILAHIIGIILFCYLWGIGGFLICVFIVLVEIAVVGMRGNKKQFGSYAPPQRYQQQKIIFTSKISKEEKANVLQILKKFEESQEIMRKTVKPETFFGRLHFSIDDLMLLQKYEKYNIFPELTPSLALNTFINDIEENVDEFIDRSYADACEKASKLKTEKGKQNAIQRYTIALETAFNTSNEFWSGSSGLPHYTGKLYTINNYEKMMELVKACTNSTIC